MKKWYKNIIFLAWIIIIAFVLLKYHISAAAIADFIHEYQEEAIIVYILLSSARGLFFLPSTPFVLAGILIFPDSKVLVLALSLSGIAISASLIYFFAEYLDVSKLFPAKNREERINKLREKLASSKGFLFIALWAFLPFTPTDLVSYVAGTVKMNFMSFIGATLAGEIIVCALYIFAGNDIWHLIIHKS